MAMYTSAGYLQLGALIGDTIRLLRTHIVPFLVVTGAVLVPLGLLDTALGQLSQSGSVSTALTDLGGGFQWQAVANMLSSSWTWSLVAGFLVSVLVHPLLNGVLVRMASQAIHGEPHHLLEDARFVARRWFRILLARLLLAVAAVFALAVPFGCFILAGMSTRLVSSSTSDAPSPFAVPLLVLMVPVILLVVVAIIATGIRLGFVTQTIIVEDQGTVASIRRSWELTRGQIWRLIGYTIVLALVVLPVRIIVEWLGSILPWIGALNIGGWITTPFDAIANTLIFYGLQAQQER